MKVLCKYMPDDSSEEEQNQQLSKVELKEYVVLALAMGLKRGVFFCLYLEESNKFLLKTAENFEIVNQRMPSSWVEVEMELFEDDVLVLLPKSWSYPSFFKEVKEGNNTARELLEKETEKMYQEEGLEIKFPPC